MVALVEDDFIGYGIPVNDIRGRLIPALLALGVATQADLNRFVNNKNLQEEIELLYQIPLVYVDSITAGPSPSKAPDKLDIENGDGTNEVLTHQNAYDGRMNISRWLYLTAFAVFIMVLFLFVQDRKNMVGFIRYMGAENINGFDVGGLLGLQDEYNGQILDEFSSHAGDFQHAFSECDMDDIHHQKYYRLPPSEDGYLCMRGWWGRLNNKVQEMYNALWIAHELNRTLIVEKEVASFFDITRWQDIYPHVKYKVAVMPRNVLSACKSSQVPIIQGPHEAKSQLIHTRAGRQKLKKDLREHKAEFLGIFATTVFYLMETDYAFLRAFFTNLYPNKQIREKADAYIAEHFNNKPYMAVHLRSLEGSCSRRMGRAHLSNDVCSPTRKQTERMVNSIQNRSENVDSNFADEFLARIFVASDHQKKDALLTYKNREDGYFYKGNCSGRECAMLDFEIAGRSDFFIGTLASSATRTIARMREFRRIRRGIYYPGVLYWNPSISLEDFSTWEG